MAAAGPRARGGDSPRPGRAPFAADMKIAIDPPELLDDLLETLRRAGCDAEKIAPGVIEAGSPAPFLTHHQARREIGFYLAVWRARHGDARAHLLN